MIVSSEEDEPAPAGAITRARAKEMIKGMQQLAEKTEEEVLERVWNVLLEKSTLSIALCFCPRDAATSHSIRKSPKLVAQPRPELVSAREIVSCGIRAQSEPRLSLLYP
ncbi:unnamed protein product [Cochlearia groenlandica]